ncbi:MAG: hypothetical protein JRM73_00085 [Nitrososphaerota archaeon]|nr:hypothetical protein [Nitrososphaerota archaeon]
MKGYCITHRKDIDGLASGSISVAATGGELVLSDYDDMVANLRRVPDDADRVVVSDLGSDTADFQAFLDEMGRIAKHAEVTYIDHHFMSEGAKKKLRKAGVRLVHDVRDCASVLTYRTFKDSLPEGARLNALFGAVTDYMDDSPTAKKMMEKQDRQFVLLEATMASLALVEKGDEEGYPEMVVAELAKMKLPHDIPGVPEAAVRQLAKQAALGEIVKKEGTKLGRLAYMATKEHSTGSVAKLLIGAFDVPVGVAMKEKHEGWYEVSLRGTSECRAHLGQAIGKISGSLGGSGGGHRKAAGCRVPKEKAEQMLKALSKKV